MFANIIWWSCDALVVCLLALAIGRGFFKRYLVFYLYLSQVLIVSVFRYPFYLFDRSVYRNVYWYTEFLSLAFGYCVVWEIYRQALAQYPGTLRMARTVILTFFIVIVASGLANSLSGPVWGAAETVMDLERNLRVVQMILLVIILGVLQYYAIPIGRNLRGIIWGYGFFIGMNVINHTVRSYLGDTFQPLWISFQSVAYLISLLIWVATLWSYHPNPTPETEAEIERDYQLLSARTALAINKARGYIIKDIKE